MSLDTLQRLETAHERLIGALDVNDVESIEKRVEELRLAIAAVRSQGAWRDSEQVKESAERIGRLGEAARLRVNFLTDLTRQRIQMLSIARGEASGGAYLRPGRQIA